MSIYIVNLDQINYCFVCGNCLTLWNRSCMLIYHLECNLPICSFSLNFRINMKYLTWILSYRGFQCTNLDPLTSTSLKSQVTWQGHFLIDFTCLTLCLLKDCKKTFPTALCLGGSLEAIRRLLHGRGNNLISTFFNY